MKQWTGEEVLQAMQLNAELLTPAEIGEYLGRTPDSIRKCLSVRGIKWTDGRTLRRQTDSETLRIRKHVARALERAANTHASGSVRDLVSMLIERFAEHPRLVELAMKAPMEDR